MGLSHRFERSDLPLVIKRTSDKYNDTSKRSIWGKNYYVYFVALALFSLKSICQFLSDIICPKVIIGSIIVILLDLIEYLTRDVREASRIKTSI